MDAAVSAFPMMAGTSSITGVSVTCNPLVPELMGLRHPGGGLQSRFSARHGIAAGLRYGRAGLAEFSDAVAADPEMGRLRDLIELTLTRLVPATPRSCGWSAAPAGLPAKAPLRCGWSTRGGAPPGPSPTPSCWTRSSPWSRRRWATGRRPAPRRGGRAAGRRGHHRPAGRDPASARNAGSRQRQRRDPARGPDAAIRAEAATSGGATSIPVPADSVLDRAPTTDVILALVLGLPALVDEVAVADQAAGQAKASLARFAHAVESGEGGAVQQAIEAALDDGVLPEGHALTAFGSAAAALGGKTALGVETAIVCAAATALGENCGEAVAIGCDVADLVAVGLPDAGARGWSAPVISAAIGATAAAGHMLGLAEPQLRAAIGIAATQAAGLRSADGTDAAPLQAGKAAFNAVEAALLAQAGVTSAAHPLEGRRGLYALFGS